MVPTNLGEAHQRTKDELSALAGPLREVLSGAYGVSEDPLVSVGYVVCDALVLANNGRGGLAHFMNGQNPRGIIEKMISELGGDPRALHAYAVTSGRNEEITGVCRSLGIRSIHTYESPDGDKRDVLYVPKAHELKVITAKDTTRVTFLSR